MQEESMEYKTTETNPHGRDEELQWVRLLSSGDPVKGMTLVLIQKMCTAFHEFEPAWHAGALNNQQIAFFRERLTNRVKRVLTMMRNNGLDTVKGFAELEELVRSTQAAQTMSELAGLAERAHTINHTICDSLEGR
jgi:2-iminoacetate synthase ThiH